VVVRPARARGRIELSIDNATAEALQRLLRARASDGDPAEAHLQAALAVALNDEQASDEFVLIARTTLQDAIATAQRARASGSNDAEHEALYDLLSTLQETLTTTDPRS
jgi:hypothetical protein